MPPPTNKRPRTPPSTNVPPRTVVDLLSSPTSPAHKKPHTQPPTSTTTNASSVDISTTLLYKTISSLPTHTKDTLLYHAATSLPSFKRDIIAAAQATPPLDFRSEVERAELCVMEGDLNPTEEDIPFAGEELSDVLDEILEKAGEGVRFESRANAVAALGQCLEFILEAEEGGLDGEDRGEWVEKYVDGIEELLGAFTDGEGKRLRGEKVWEKLKNVAEREGGEGLKRVLGL